MCINFTLTYIGLHWLGRDGAAWALVAHHIISLVIVYGVLKRHVNIQMRNIIGYIFSNYGHAFQLLKKTLLRRSQESVLNNGQSQNIPISEPETREKL